ncbi:hypothetical protein HPULCUR_005656 [Helicostylum pulchrum]|uniref:Uncharacterized protein n=1 Tax=Helicostylum pulchrum TaxID=562976 RepID=A0ABP9XZT7_9FUNG
MDDKEMWDEEDTFLIKAVSDYLPLAIDYTMKKMYLEKESIDLFHYAFIIPSEWEEEIRDDIIRPIFVQSGLISNEDHQDRLLFFSDIESMFYCYSFKRGDNTILCRITPGDGKAIVKFDLIQTSSTLYNFPNASLFPKVMKSSSVSVITGDIENHIAEFLRVNLFYVATDDDRVRNPLKRFLKSKLVPFYEDWIIEDIMEQINSQPLPPLRYLLGDLADFTTDDGVSIKKDLLFEMKALLTKELFNGETLIPTNKPKYIKAFILMYMIYIKEEILNKLPDHLISNHTDMKIGYAISVEAMLLNNTIGTKDSLQDIIFASGLVPKDDDSKKLRITMQGERILPAIQKPLKLQLSLKSYFLVCQLHEDYVQLSLHQVVTAPNSEEEEQESIIVQDEILAIPNIYDSLCTSMWQNLVQDSSLIELCEMHITSDDNKILVLFSSKTKTEFFANLKGHISDNVRVVLQNNPGTQSTADTHAVKLNSFCSCKVRLTTADIIDVSFTPVLQDIACTLSASLLNKELFGNYVNIDYMFSFIRFNSNPQLQYAFSKILEEEADDFNLELGIDTSCLLVPELFSQLLQPVISQRPLCYKDFKIGALQQVCSENYVFRIVEGEYDGVYSQYKSKITYTETIECDYRVAFPFLNKGELISNVRTNRPFYLRNQENNRLSAFSTGNNIPE